MYFAGVDTETEKIEVGYTIPKVVVMSVSVAAEDAARMARHMPAGALKGRTGSDVWWLVSHQDAPGAWASMLGDPELHMAIHNSAFDLCTLMRASGLMAETFKAVAEGRFWCTRVRARLMALTAKELSFRYSVFKQRGDIASFTLAEEVMRLFSVDLRDVKYGGDVWRTRYSELMDVPLAQWPIEAVTYAAEDAVWHLRLLFAQAQHPVEIGGYPTRGQTPEGSPLARFAGEEREVRASLALQLGASWGLRTDQDQVFETLADWHAAAQKGQAIGRKAGFVRTALHKRGKKKGTPTKKDGTKDLKVLRGMIEDNYAALGIEPPLTDTGLVKTAEEVLMATGDEVLVAYAKCMQKTNWVGKFGDILLNGAFAPVTYRIESMVSTGRTAISKPPLQQAPRSDQFRACFVPRPGYLYASADYDQIELRCIAQLHIWWGLGDTMAQAFREGLDPHVLMASDILNAEGHATPQGTSGGWSYDLVQRCRAGDFASEWKAIAKDYRQMAKAANFGYPGGLQAKTLIKYAAKAYSVVLTREKAEELREIWLRRWPEMEGYFGVIRSRLNWGDSFVAQQHASGRLRGGCGYCDGANTYFQGLAADGFKWAAWEIARACYATPESPLYGSRMVLPLHDEFLLEVPEEGAHEAAKELERLMVSSMGRHTPDVPISTEAVLMRRWMKDAKPKTQDGRLVPWEPKRENTTASTQVTTP